MATKTAGIGSGPREMLGNVGPGMLAGLRVVEIADERGEYTGLLLAGLGCEVIKIEPVGGEINYDIARKNPVKFYD